MARCGDCSNSTSKGIHAIRRILHHAEAPWKHCCEVIELFFNGLFFLLSQVIALKVTDRHTISTDVGLMLGDLSHSIGKFKSVIAASIFKQFDIYPPTPALAKAGAAPGTTAGVELLLVSFPRSKPISQPTALPQGHIA